MVLVVEVQVVLLSLQQQIQLEVLVAMEFIILSQVQQFSIHKVEMVEV